jgi:hypothetical protein
MSVERIVPSYAGGQSRGDMPTCVVEYVCVKDLTLFLSLSKHSSMNTCTCS